MKTALKLTPDELEEKYRDPDELADERIERMAKREEQLVDEEQIDPDSSETHFL